MAVICHFYASFSLYIIFVFAPISLYGGVGVGVGGRGWVLLHVCKVFLLLLIQPSVKGDNAELEPIDSWLITQGMVRTSPVALSPPQCPSQRPSVQPSPPSHSC